MNKDTQTIWENYSQMAPAPKEIDISGNSQMAAAPDEIDINKPVDTNKYNMYQHLVGYENVQHVKQMFDRLSKGQAPTPQQLQIFQPAFDMINQIVAGGPQKINQVKKLITPAAGRPGTAPVNPTAPDKGSGYGV